MNAFKKACLLFLAGLLAVTPFVLLVGVGVAVRGNAIGVRFLHVVLSFSMQPAFNRGDMIIVKPCAPEDVRAGDIITYALNDDVFITHRVVEILTERGGEQGLWFVTKGDANVTADALPVEASQLVGRMTGRLPGMGAILNWLRDHPVVSLLAMMLLLLLSSPAAVLLLWLALRKRRKKVQNFPLPPCNHTSPVL